MITTKKRVFQQYRSVSEPNDAFIGPVRPPSGNIGESSSLASATLFVSRSPVIDLRVLVTISWIPSRREGVGELDSQGIIDQSQRIACHIRQIRLGSGESAQQHDRFAIGDRSDRFDGGRRRRSPEHRLEGGSCFLSSETAERAGGRGSHSWIEIGQQVDQTRVDVCLRAREIAGDGAHLGIGVPQERQDSRRGQSAPKGRRDADMLAAKACGEDQIAAVELAPWAGSA